MTGAHCNWPMCVDRAERESPWCAQHRLLAVQHDASHELEGHSHAIDGCPTCEDPDGWSRGTQEPQEARRRESWTDPCPERGPALSHARHTYDPPGVCIHCGTQIG